MEGTLYLCCYNVLMSSCRYFGQVEVALTYCFAGSAMLGMSWWERHGGNVMVGMSRWKYHHLNIMLGMSCYNAKYRSRICISTTPLMPFFLLLQYQMLYLLLVFSSLSVTHQYTETGRANAIIEKVSRPTETN